MHWDEVAGAPGDAVPAQIPQRRWLRPAYLVPLAVVALFVVTGRIVAAVLVTVVTLVIAQLSYVSPTFAAGFPAALARFGHAVGRVLSLVLIGAVNVVVFVPVSLLSHLGRRELGRPPHTGRAGWIDRLRAVGRPSPGQPFERAPRVAGNPVLRVVGVVAVVLVVDLALGTLLGGTNVLPAGQTQETQSDRARVEAWTESEALRDEPWADAYVDELFGLGKATEPTYEPFVVWELDDYDGTYINQADGRRLSYQPEAAASGDLPSVAFFGGSTMFGQGQRDEHTIASEFARVAEESGRPVEVHNFGVTGYAIWQEYLSLERRLAHGERFDAVVFYDGFNDLNAQREFYSEDPTHTGRTGVQEVAERQYEENRSPGVWDRLGDLVGAYGDASASGRLIDRWWGDDDPTTSGSAPEATDEERLEATVEVYGRAVGRVTDLADAYGVPVFFFWQPQRDGWPESVLAALPESTHDISGVFAGREDEVYVDLVHTNEEGAHLVAEAMWPVVSRRLEPAG